MTESSHTADLVRVIAAALDGTLRPVRGVIDLDAAAKNVLVELHVHGYEVVPHNGQFRDGQMTTIRSESCTACPYRRDVPSGVWAATEYEKLAEYDGFTGDQPAGAFHCHATPEVICHGWAVVHGRQDHAHEPLAFRLWGIDPTTVEEHTPLFASGTEACEHGKQDIENPSQEAQDVVARLQNKYERLR